MKEIELSPDLDADPIKNPALSSRVLKKEIVGFSDGG